MPAGSKMDPPLAKAELISNGGRKKKKKQPVEYQQQRGVRIHDRNSFVDAKVSEEGGRGGASGTVPVVKTKAVPLQPWRPMVKQMSN
ncbi:protein pxr1-like [Willisornis vidua]|uniref:Protein pxr1-like n=1 Tax=Willisornis vidua TaxID=1566151 RepID=A0ABQ9DD07_9PASS|nr:protein pxr1-like [Willisornis vidua]